MKLQFLAVAIFLLFSPVVQAQFFYSGEMTAQGQYATGERLPFWMYHNKRGRISENTNAAGWITVRGIQDLTYNSTFEIGAGVLYRDGLNNGVFLDELFAQYENQWLRVIAGRKQQEELYNGISAANRSLLWSLNPRPIPGLQIKFTRPIFIFPDAGIGIEGEWNEYFLERERYVTNARLHHKNLLLVYQPNETFFIKTGLQHFVQWGGDSPRFGSQPQTSDDYFRVITGQDGGPNDTLGTHRNALGNHLGGYEIYIRKAFQDFSVELFYNHIFEDGSGRRLGNTPDGRYGVYLESTEKYQFVNSLIYEFIYTHHQSHTTTGPHKYDNYFNNGIYRSGWTYENRVIGVPFFTVNPHGQGIINNKFTAHHLGFGGQYSPFFNTYPYKVMMSYAYNDGVYPRRFRPKQHVGSFYAELGLLRGTIDLDIQFATEFNTYTAPSFGVGLQVRRRF